MITGVFWQSNFLHVMKGGIDIVSTIQLFNWVTKTYYGTYLSLWKLIGPLAFFLQFVAYGYLRCFPNMPYFLSYEDVDKIPTGWCDEWFDTTTVNDVVVPGYRK